MSNDKQIQAVAMKLADVFDGVPTATALCAVASVLAAIGLEGNIPRDLLIDALDTARNSMLRRRSNG
jgi:hypothetical protein